jgi:hypothetical protein
MIDALFYWLRQRLGLHQMIGQHEDIRADLRSIRLILEANSRTESDRLSNEAIARFQADPILNPKSK